MEEECKICNQSGVFSLTQWNTLADSLSDSFPKCDIQYLLWNYRSNLLMNHLKQKAMSDLICLEEVDHPDFFRTFLDPTHEVLFHRKPQGKDGQLVAVSRDKFEIEEKQAHQFITEGGSEMSQSFWHILLKEKASGKRIMLIATHLKAKKQFENIRLQQIRQILSFLADLSEIDLPVIITGDLNAEPSYESIKLLNDTPYLTSAYDYTKNTFTTFKIREQNDIQCRVIDYIFYSHKNLRLLSTRSLPSKESVGYNGLPNQQFSSDHLSLNATFLLL